MKLIMLTNDRSVPRDNECCLAFENKKINSNTGQGGIPYCSKTPPRFLLGRAGDKNREYGNKLMVNDCNMLLTRATVTQFFCQYLK